MREDWANWVKKDGAGRGREKETEGIIRLRDKHLDCALWKEEEKNEGRYTWHEWDYLSREKLQSSMSSLGNDSPLLHNRDKQFVLSAHAHFAVVSFTRLWTSWGLVLSFLFSIYYLTVHTTHATRLFLDVARPVKRTRCVAWCLYAASPICQKTPRSRYHKLSARRWFVYYFIVNFIPDSYFNIPITY